MFKVQSNGSCGFVYINFVIYGLSAGCSDKKNCTEPSLNPSGKTEQLEIGKSKIISL